MLDKTSLRAARLGRAAFLWIVLALAAATILAVWCFGFVLVLDWPFAALWLPPLVGFWFLAFALRLRDMGRSRWMLLVPLALSGAVVLLSILMVRGGDQISGYLAVFGLLFGLAAIWFSFVFWLARAPGAAAFRDDMRAAGLLSRSSART